MNQPWNMAKARSRQRLTPLKYKPVGPVGEKQDCATAEMRERCKSRWGKEVKSIYLAYGEVSCCKNCGHHVCSCKPEFINERVCCTLSAGGYACDCKSQHQSLHFVDGNTRSCMRHAMLWDANFAVGCPACLEEQRQINHSHVQKLKEQQEYIDRMKELEEHNKQRREAEYYTRMQQQHIEQHARQFFYPPPRAGKTAQQVVEDQENLQRMLGPQGGWR